MAFCMYCGKKLEDGEVCNCNEAQAVEENVVDVQQENVTVLPSMEDEQMNPGMSFNQAQQGYQQDVQSQQMYQQNPQQQGYQQDVQSQQMYQQNPQQQGYQQDVQSQQMYQQNPQQQGYQQDAQSQQMYQQNLQQQGYQQDAQSQQMYQQNPQQQAYQQNPQMQQMYQQNSQQFNEVKEKSSMYLKELLNSWLCILKKPVSMGRRFVGTGSNGIAIGLIVIQAILTAIFGCVLAGKMNGTLKSAYVGTYSAASTYFPELNKFLLNIPTVFILSLIASLIASFALAGLLLAGAKICKGNNASYRSMLCAVGVRAVGISVLQVVTLLMCLFSVPWSIAFFYIVAEVIGLLFLVPVVSVGSGIDENKLGYMLFVVLIAFTIVTGILTKVVAPMYVPSGYKEYMDELEDGLDEIMDKFSDLEDLLNY